MKRTTLSLMLAAGLSAGGAHAAANLINETYGVGVGSFEVGAFAPRGDGNFAFQTLDAGDAAMTGWTVGGVGVDWLSETYYGASDGIHAVDLGWYTGGAGSLSISLPTVVGAVYA